MQARLQALLANYPGATVVEQVSHSSTRQRSLRVRLLGRLRPSEIVVLGGHLDSVGRSFGQEQGAPGADDNASGSASLVEALRVLASKGVPERTVEFYWYAGEESGLRGSSEIAQTYKREGKDVVAVLQLDMTLFPGSGELVMANISDFTNPWLRSYLAALNEHYVSARLVESRCGYGCSDHASWHRQGFPALFPFEAEFRSSNRDIHTDRDRINSRSSFRHALAFSKVALAMAMDLGNSTARPSN
jgi:leucyl aminopeptidase